METRKSSFTNPRGLYGGERTCRSQYVVVPEKALEKGPNKTKGKKGKRKRIMDNWERQIN